MSDDAENQYGTFDLTSSHGDRPEWGWDYAFVFSAPAQVSSEEGDVDVDESLVEVNEAKSALLEALRNAGISYSHTWVPVDEVVVVRLGMTEDVMLVKAERDGIKLRLKPEYGGGYLAFELDRAHVFENELRRAKGKAYFSPAERVFLMLSTLRSRDDWGAGVNMEVMKRKGVLKQAFALHVKAEKEALVRELVGKSWWRPSWVLPLDKLRNYFGTTVTIYLAWLAFYARMLLGLAGLSIIVSIVLVKATSPEVRAWTRVVFGVGICFWGNYWFENWKRRNAVLNVKWGMDDFYEDNENDIRADFSGDERLGFYSRGGFVNLEDLDSAAGTRESLRQRQIIRTVRIDTSATSGDSIEQDVVLVGGDDDADFRLEAPVTGMVFSDLPTFPYSDKNTRQWRTYASAVVTACFAIVVAILSFCILFFKAEIIDFFGADSFGKFVPGIATALLISFSDPMWKDVSLRLNRWENHRTIQEYESNLLMKRFAFQFVSNYISLFYIAFVKPFTPADPCLVGVRSGEPDCMFELESQLTSLIITKATVQQLMEVGVPFITFRVNRYLQQLQTRQLRSEIDEHEHRRLLAAGASLEAADHDDAVKESKMAPYKSTMQDYGELVIQHGFLVLFGMAFPLAAVINLLNNIIETRTDTYKLLAVQQRPDAHDAADIGGWLYVLRFLSVTSVITTAALLTITTPALQRILPNFIGDTAEDYPATSFLIFEHLLLAVRWGVGVLILDVPASTYRLRARQDFLIAKCFDVGWKPYYRGNGERSVIKH